MARVKSLASKRQERRAPRPEPLGRGLHGGIIELQSGTSFRVRTLEGERLDAVLGDDVDVGLAEDCLRTGRMVILCDTPRGVTIAGALQTTRPFVKEQSDGRVCIEAGALELRAERGLVIECGPVALRMDTKGVMRAEGERMVIDMGSNVRVLSALVELP
jgi:hypothetical protein